MNSPSSLMLQETEQSPAVVAGLLEKEAGTFSEIARIFQKNEPAVITTAARGSSDHAATFFKYLMEITMGIPVASIGPSVASVYGSKLKLKNGLHFTVSQSGASRTLLQRRTLPKGGATTIAVVNVVDSPLGNAADVVLALNAGEEKSVAATKSFIAAVAALSGVVASASGDASLQVGLQRLPEALAATRPDGREAVENLLFNARSLYTGGRGTAFAIALEAALKAKETANIHAEAFSGRADARSDASGGRRFPDYFLPAAR